jgi:hypothetical protein
MSEPPKRPRAKTYGIRLPGLSKLHNLLSNNGCTFVGAVSQLRRFACHSKGGAHRLDHLGAKAPIGEAVRHQRFLRVAAQAGMHSPRGISMIQPVFLLGSDTWATIQKKVSGVAARLCQTARACFQLAGRRFRPAPINSMRAGLLDKSRYFGFVLPNTQL